MKAISLWQPWASAMALGLKQNETRSWATTHRGPLLIHAAQRAEHWPNVIVQAHFEGIAFQPTDLPRGCLLCVVNLIACTEIDWITMPPDPERSFGDYRLGRYVWITEPLWTFDTPIPFRGRQGLFNVDDGLFMQAPYHFAGLL